RQRFYAFLERFCLPVVTTGDAKGLFPEKSPLSLRNYGLGGSPWPSAYVHPETTSPGLPAKYDALCVLGSSLSQLSTNTWSTEMTPNGPLIQVDADQRVIGRGYPITRGIVGELGAFIDRLTELAEHRVPDPARCADRRRHLDRVHRVLYPNPNPQAELVIAIA